jgi:hypothetical protein
MINRFHSVGIVPKFPPPVYRSDPRLNDAEQHKLEIRTCAIMLQHLDGIRDFFENTNSDYCIVCEDDIYISRNFHQELEEAVYNFRKLDLDVLLLGYLLNFKIENNYFPLIGGHSYHKYPDDLWGSQMYMISRKHAKYLLEKYTIEWAKSNKDKPFSPDWTLTKEGNRALIYPMMAVEEGIVKCDHPGQISFHKSVFECNYNPNKYI